MKRLLIWLLLAVFAPLACAEGPEAAPFRIGLFPNLSPLTLIATHQPLANYLAQSLGQPVELLTAPDFETFVERTDAGLYDAVLTAPHLARLAEQNGHYRAAATYDQKLRAVLIVSAESTRLTVHDLKGATIAEPDPLAVVGMLGREMIANANLDANSVNWVNVHSHNGAALAVASGRADAAAVGSPVYAHLSEALRSSLRILATSRALPNQVWLLNLRLSDQRQLAFQAALLKFAATRAGQHYLKANNYGGIRALHANELKPLDPFAAQVRELLDQKP